MTRPVRGSVSVRVQFPSADAGAWRDRPPGTRAGAAGILSGAISLRPCLIRSHSTTRLPQCLCSGLSSGRYCSRTDGFAAMSGGVGSTARTGSCRHGRPRVSFSECSSPRTFRVALCPELSGSGPCSAPPSALRVSPYAGGRSDHLARTSPATFRWPPNMSLSSKGRIDIYVIRRTRARSSCSRVSASGSGTCSVLRRASFFPRLATSSESQGRRRFCGEILASRMPSTRAILDVWCPAFGDGTAAMRGIQPALHDPITIQPSHGLSS